MRSLLSVLAFSSAVIVGVACATSDASIDPPPAEQNATEPPAKIPENATPPPPPPPPPEKKCVDTCETDEDCQNSCPAAPSGQQNCCDATKKCWKAAAAVCPKPEDGGQPPAY